MDGCLANAEVVSVTDVCFGSTMTPVPAEGAAAGAGFVAVTPGATTAATGRDATAEATAEARLALAEGAASVGDERDRPVGAALSPDCSRETAAAASSSTPDCRFSGAPAAGDGKLGGLGMGMGDSGTELSAFCLWCSLLGILGLTGLAVKSVLRLGGSSLTASDADTASARRDPVGVEPGGDVPPLLLNDRDSGDSTALELSDLVSSNERNRLMLSPGAPLKERRLARVIAVISIDARRNATCYVSVPPLIQSWQASITLLPRPPCARDATRDAAVPGTAWWLMAASMLLLRAASCVDQNNAGRAHSQPSLGALAPISRTPRASSAARSRWAGNQ